MSYTEDAIPNECDIWRQILAHICQTFHSLSEFDTLVAKTNLYITCPFPFAKCTLPLQDEETVHFLSRLKMWTVYIRDQTAHSVQSDLDLHCPKKPLVSSTVKKELNLYQASKF